MGMIVCMTNQCRTNQVCDRTAEGTGVIRMLIVHHEYAVCAFMFAFDLTLGVKAITLVI